MATYWLFVLTTVLLGVVKLAGWESISWWLVFTPALLPFVLDLILLCVAVSMLLALRAFLAFLRFAK